MAEMDWKDALKVFFAERAKSLSAKPSLADLCWASGREARIWSSPERHAALGADVLKLLHANSESRILEVGSGSGYVAKAVAPRVNSYVGVDVADRAVELSSRLRLTKATFRYADGAKLPFAHGSFDAAFCYDVFTNFPSMSDGVPIIAEMVRVVRVGGRVLVGSIPDAATKDEFERVIPVVIAELESLHGPAHTPAISTARNLWNRARRRFDRSSSTGGIICYYFNKEDFLSLGRKLNVGVEILPVHSENPYADYRFNAVYEKSPP